MIFQLIFAALSCACRSTLSRIPSPPCAGSRAWLCEPKDVLSRKCSWRETLRQASTVHVSWGSLEMGPAGMTLPQGAQSQRKRQGKEAGTKMPVAGSTPRQQRCTRRCCSAGTQRRERKQPLRAPTAFETLSAPHQTSHQTASWALSSSVRSSCCRQKKRCSRLRQLQQLRVLNGGPA